MLDRLLAAASFVVVCAIVAFLIRASVALRPPLPGPVVVAEVPVGTEVVTPRGLAVVERTFRELDGLAYVVRLDSGRRVVMYRAHLHVVAGVAR